MGNIELKTGLSPDVLLGTSYGASVVLSIPGLKNVTVGSIADLWSKVIIVEATKKGGTSMDFARYVDTPNLLDMDVLIPPTEAEQKYTEGKWATLNERGALQAAQEALAQSIAQKLDVWMLQGPDATTEMSMNDLIYGFMEMSSADGSSPLKAKGCDGGNTAEDWEDAGKAQTDLLKLKGVIRAKGFTGKIALLYPLDAGDAFEHDLVVGTGIYSGKSILTYAKENFDYVIPVGDDIDGYCVMTGAAETSQDFQIAAMAVDWFKVATTRDVTFESIHDEVANEFILRSVANKSLIPIPRKVGSYWYKGMAEIDSIDYSD